MKVQKPIGEPAPSILDTSIELSEIYVHHENHKLLIGRNTDSPIELGANWRQRGQPICKAVRQSDDDALWLRESTRADLVRFEDKYIWLPVKSSPEVAAQHPDLIELKDYFKEIVECLKLWRNNLKKPQDYSVRLNLWLKSKPNAAAWIAHIAEMILVKFAPWPEPFNLRPENDSEHDWSSEQSLKKVLPLFGALTKAPLRGTPPNLVATFLYLIQRRNVDAHAWAGEFVEAWNFKVRTYDHSWINGEIIGDSVLGSTSPLKFQEIDGEHGGTDYCISCTGINCFISEEKNPRY